MTPTPHKLDLTQFTVDSFATVDPGPSFLLTAQQQTVGDPLTDCYSTCGFAYTYVDCCAAPPRRPTRRGPSATRSGPEPARWTDAPPHRPAGGAGRCRVVSQTSLRFTTDV